MIGQKLREHPIGVGGEVVTRNQKYAMPIPDSGRPCGRVELSSASFAKAGYAPLPEYVEPIDSPVNKPGSDYPLVLAAFRSVASDQPKNLAMASAASGFSRCTRWPAPL